MRIQRDPDTYRFWPTRQTIFDTVRDDWARNSRNPKIQLALVLFRFCQVAMKDRDRPRLISYPLIALYRFITEIILGFELRPKTIVGRGISIHHGFGLVVNDGAILGRHVHLRNGVTIGHKAPESPPPVIGDRVEIGANAVIIGNIYIADGSKVGAGAVVVKSCQPNSILVGNPAKDIAATQARRGE